MVRLIVQRFLSSAVTLALLTVFVFFAVELLPGDTCTAYLGRDAKGDRLENCRENMGLNRPAVERFADWASGAVVGDFGVSPYRNKPVSEIVGWRMRNTIVLALAASAFGIPLAIFLGILAGIRRDRPVDMALSSTSILAMTVPEFVSATLLILVFSISLGWTSGVVTAPADAPIGVLLGSTVLPTVALALVFAAHILRMVRSSVIDVMESEYVAMARLKGLPFRWILMRHVLPNSLLPAINVIGLTVAWLLGGVVVIESVFNYPGLGRLAVDAVADRDLPLTQCIVLILATCYIGTNLVTDLASLLLNPRLRTFRG